MHGENREKPIMKPSMITFSYCSGRRANKNEYNYNGKCDDLNLENQGLLNENESLKQRLKEKNDFIKKFKKSFMQKKVIVVTRESS